MIDLMLLAAAFVGVLRLGADQRLRRTLALGDMRAIEAALVDLPMKMLAPLLGHGESADALGGIAQESAQGGAIFAPAAQLGFALPVLRRLGGLRRRGAKLGEAVLQ
ncbi:MAG: hypothetical protein U0793_25470 [Gemmataceae bacterium]